MDGVEGHREDEKAVEMGEEGSLRLQEGVVVGDEAAANLKFLSKWNLNKFNHETSFFSSSKKEFKKVLGECATYNHRQASRSEGNTYTKSVGMIRHDLEGLSYL